MEQSDAARFRRRRRKWRGHAGVAVVVGTWVRIRYIDVNGDENEGRGDVTQRVTKLRLNGPSATRISIVEDELSFFFLFLVIRAHRCETLSFAHSLY